MTDEKDICLLCDSPLKPTHAKILRDFYEISRLLIEVYKTAFEGAISAVHRDHFEYNRLRIKLCEKVQQHNDIVKKYISIIDEIRSKN